MGELTIFQIESNVTIRTNVRFSGGIVKTGLDKKVLKAATELFAIDGFASVGIRAIANKAATSIGTVYHYFGGKQEILEAVLRKEVEARKDLLHELRGQGLSFEDQVGQLLLSHFTLLRESPAATKVYFQERLNAGSPLRSTLRNLHNEVIAYIERLLTEGIRSGAIVSCNPTIAAYAIVGLIEALSRRALDADETAELIMQQGPTEMSRLLASWLRDDKTVKEGNDK